MEVKGKRIRRWISVVLLLTFLCTTVMTTNAQENSGDLETMVRKILKIQKMIHTMLVMI